MAKISDTQPQRSRLCFRVIRAGWNDAMHLKKYKHEAQASEYAILLTLTHSLARRASISIPESFAVLN
jgi:hypothetical protein